VKRFRKILSIDPEVHAHDPAVDNDLERDIRVEMVKQKIDVALESLAQAEHELKGAGDMLDGDSGAR
jgi:hypothetical protein